MDPRKILQIGTAVYFSVETEEGNVLEKEGEIQEICEEDLTYEVLVHGEGRVYRSVPAAIVREITAASGVEDGEYGFTEEDNDIALMNTVESLWYGMDPRGSGEEEAVFGNRLSEETERILLNGLNEDASGFFVDSDDPPEEE